jgi:hypothetical protein
MKHGENAKRKLIEKNTRQAQKFEICFNLIKDFEGVNTKKEIQIRL